MLIRSVAVIGIGAMGAPMARRLQAAGFELTVCDSNAAAVAAFSGTGAQVAQTPADSAGADATLILVSTPQQVRDVVLGARGILAGSATPRTTLLVVMSTVSAEVLQDISRQLPSTVRMIDAPISGGVRGAEEGTLTILTGGDEQDLRAIKPVLDQLGAQQIPCGSLGDAQTMKILNNTLGISIAVIAGEVYRLAIERGLDPARVSLVLEACSGRNSRSKDPAGPQSGYAVLAGDRTSYARTEGIMRKDLGLVVEMAAKSKGEYPMLRGLKALVDALGDETFDNWRRIAESPSIGHRPTEVGQ
jgi:3-hydroxyisobutyrate dehydrogenase